MSLSFELSIEVSEQYDFNKLSLSKIEQNTWENINKGKTIKTIFPKEIT